MFDKNAQIGNSFPTTISRETIMSRGLRAGEGFVFV